MLGEIDLIRRRETQGGYVNGYWVPGETVDTPIKGSLQPAGGDDLQALPEGRRTSTTLKLYTRSEISLGGDGIGPDRIVDGNEEYEAVTVMTHRVGPIAHTKAMLQAVT